MSVRKTGPTHSTGFSAGGDVSGEKRPATFGGGGGRPDADTPGPKQDETGLRSRGVRGHMLRRGESLSHAARSPGYGRSGY